MRVKICGITNYDDARLALDLGADELGFILAPSPRRAEPRAVADILGRLRTAPGQRPFSARGVFVNEAPEAMGKLLRECGLDGAQIHGDEDGTSCSRFPFPWYRAFRLGGEEALGALSRGPWTCGRYLVDAFSPSAYGGTGRRLDAGLARKAKAIARAAGAEFWLAGGLSPDNVIDAVVDL